MKTFFGCTYKRRTDRGLSVVGKHGDSLRRYSLCDLPPTELAPPRPCVGSNQKSLPCWDNKWLQLYVPRHLFELAVCCRVFHLKLLRKTWYGAFHLFAKTLRDNPTKYPPHRHRCLGMGSDEKRKPQTNDNMPAAEFFTSSTCYTFRRSAPPSSSLYRKRKPDPQTDAMAYAIARSKDFYKSEEHNPALWNTPL